MQLTRHSMLLGGLLVLSGSAQAQFRGTVEPMPAVPAPMASPVPVMAPDLGTSTAPITSAPSLAPDVSALARAAPETTGAIPAAEPTAMAPGCPGGGDCPPEAEGEGPFSEAVKEMVKEFAKCEAEGKSLDTCLSDDPPPHLAQLTQEDRAQLAQCLGSSDLSATKVRWSGCLVGAD